MYIEIGGQKFPCGGASFGASLIWRGIEGLELPIAGMISTCRDDGFVMREDDTGDWLRQEYGNGTLTLTNEPEPVPTEPPDAWEPLEPEITLQDILELMYMQYGLDFEEEEQNGKH